jgi:hypothetical protein
MYAGRDVNSFYKKELKNIRTMHLGCLLPLDAGVDADTVNRLKSCEFNI